jgi:hypothetical protein
MKMTFNFIYNLARLSSLPRAHSRSPRGSDCCQKEPVRQPTRRRAPGHPFARCELGSLRLLAGFVLVSDEAEPVRSALIRLAEWPQGRLCHALPSIVAATREHARVARVLDGVLEALLGDAAEQIEGLSIAALAELWQRERSRLSGESLAALVWRLARDGRTAAQPLERRVVRCVQPVDLLSTWQRAALFGDVGALSGAADTTATRALGSR